MSLAAEPWAKLHQLTAAQLQDGAEAATNPADQLRFELASTRRVAEADFKTGIRELRRLVAIIDKDQSGDEWHYAQAALAETLLRDGELDAARIILEKHFSPAVDDIDLSAQSIASYAKGFMQFRTSDPQTALVNFRDAQKLAERAGDPVQSLLARNGEGVAYLRMGLTHEAIDVLSGVQKDINFVPPDSSLPLLLHHNLSYLYSVAGEYDKAIEGYTEAVDWALEHEQWTRAYVMVAGLGHALIRSGRPEQAIARIEEIRGLPGVNAALDAESACLLLLATAYQQTGRLADASNAITAASDLIDYDNDPLRAAELDVVKARLLASTGKPQTSIEILDQVIERLSAQPTSAILQETLETAAQIHSQQGNDTRALDLTNAAYAIERKNRTEEHDAMLGALRVQNELSAKQRELDLLEQEARAALTSQQLDLAIQALLILGGLAALLTCYVIYIKLSRERRARTKLEGEFEKRTQQVQFELQGRLSAERDKAQLEQRIAEDEKLRAIAELTGGLSHDFNNIMTVISCSAELIRMRHAGPNDQDTRELTDDILAATDSGAKVTSALLSYARQHPLRPQLTRLDRFFETHYSMFRNTLGENLSLSIDAHPVVVEIDQSLLTTSVLNLLFNARDAIDGHGEVAITVRSERNPNGQDIAAIQITDNGSGMDTQTRERAMEPFFTTKPGGKGSGLGLSMVYGFARQSNALLSIESEPGVGTTMRLEMDAKALEPTEEKDALSAELVDESPHRARILLVEDQEPIRRLAERALSSGRVDVTVCADGESAIRVLNSSPAFDVVVTDILMPGKFDGHDVANCARSLSNHTEVLMTSGHAERVPVEFDFLAKPYSVDTLVSAVRVLLKPARSRPSLN